MTMWRLRLFGYEIASLECDGDEPIPDGIGGGTMHSFERDDKPFDPNNRGDFEWEDRFGFR